jgi:hypothetical protein
MTADHIKPEDLAWECFRCNRRLTPGPVEVDYLGNKISTELPQCPTCHMVLISEELALGKVAEVEKMLEDK